MKNVVITYSKTDFNQKIWCSDKKKNLFIFMMNFCYCNQKKVSINENLKKASDV